MLRPLMKSDKADVTAQLVTPRELADLLRISAATLWRWDELGKIPAPVLRKPGCTRWRAREIEEWLEAGSPDREEWSRGVRLRSRG